MYIWYGSHGKCRCVAIFKFHVSHGSTLRQLVAFNVDMIDDDTKSVCPRPTALIIKTPKSVAHCDCPAAIGAYFGPWLQSGGRDIFYFILG